MDRLDELQKLLAADPTDSFLLYAMAMEHLKRGDIRQAIIEFQRIIDHDPAYVAAYFMCGRALRDRGDKPAAHHMWIRGIAKAREIGDSHAASEMSEELSLLQ
jgi:tetratricopeptide (TPR) repeat protein